ncbi:MAG: hypothetical protein LQ340_002217 [Diploschistes diacapsis]|nr:MAG: hypothetical protein LQ340_002217 [Diploschistes diacapsis]
MSSPASLPPYKALSFDIYGTLIDWETGILSSLDPLTSRLPASHPCKDSPSGTIAAFAKHEHALMRAHPTMLYDELLQRAYLALAAEWCLDASEHEAAGTARSIPSWAAFPDTVAAVRALGRKHKLVALSNITRASFAKTVAGPLQGFAFDAVYTAEDIGSYKPDRRNFEYLLEHVRRDLGVQKGELLHVAHGVESDQVPAEELGIAHVWVRRGKDNWGDVKKMEGLREFETLQEVAKAAGA